MKKIATLFDRDWDGNRGVVPRWGAEAADTLLRLQPDGLYATEKLDGTNVRLTFRNGEVVRVEKRRNPSKDQKGRGITEPWYVDAVPGPEDQAILSAAENVPWSDPDLLYPPDGEWSGEAIGPKIQGNPLGLIEHMVILFSLGQAPELDDAPSLVAATYNNRVAEFFEAVQQYLSVKRSALNPDFPIEGIVWHNAYDNHLKIKAKDFK